MAQRYCDHEFHVIRHAKIDMQYGELPVEPALIACAYCGQIRHLYPDGKVIIAYEEGKVEKRPNGNASNTNHRA